MMDEAERVVYLSSPGNGLTNRLRLHRVSLSFSRFMKLRLKTTRRQIPPSFNMRHAVIKRDSSKHTQTPIQAPFEESCHRCSTLANSLTALFRNIGEADRVNSVSRGLYALQTRLHNRHVCRGKYHRERTYVRRRTYVLPRRRMERRLEQVRWIEQKDRRLVFHRAFHRQPGETRVFPSALSARTLSTNPHVDVISSWFAHTHTHTYTCTRIYTANETTNTSRSNFARGRLTADIQRLRDLPM